MNRNENIPDLSEKLRKIGVNTVFTIKHGNELKSLQEFTDYIRNINFKQLIHELK